MKREVHKRKATWGNLPAAEARRRALEQQKLAKEARGEALQKYLTEGGNPDVVVPELIPDEKDQARLERLIRTGANQASLHPKGRARNRKIDQLIPLVAELCVVERVLALDPLERAGLRPSQLAGMAQTSPKEMYGKLAELVAGVVGGGDAPKLEVPRG